jgi:hypothetical protein
MEDFAKCKSFGKTLKFSSKLQSISHIAINERIHILDGKFK